ncbi:kinase-like domain-containing protein, partial [Catenaria anguillulae PL171]
FIPPRSPEYVLVLELCEGGSLWSYVRSNPTTVGRRRWMRWARQLAQAVAAMHAHRIVHHDIKPQNILLDEFQGIKLSDLG